MNIQAINRTGRPIQDAMLTTYDSTTQRDRQLARAQDALTERSRLDCEGRADGRSVSPAAILRLIEAHERRANELAQLIVDASASRQDHLTAIDVHRERLRPFVTLMPFTQLWTDSAGVVHRTVVRIVGGDVVIEQTAEPIDGDDRETARELAAEPGEPGESSEPGESVGGLPMASTF